MNTLEHYKLSWIVRCLCVCRGSVDPPSDLLKRVHPEGHIHARTVGEEGSQGSLLKQSKDQDFVPGMNKHTHKNARTHKHRHKHV